MKEYKSIVLCPRRFGMTAIDGTMLKFAWSQEDIAKAEIFRRKVACVLFVVLTAALASGWLI